MDARLLEILVCPLCKGALQPLGDELVCKADRLAFARKEGIAIMLADEAREMSAEEVEQLRRHRPQPD